MATSILDKLKQLSQEDLIDIILQLSQENSHIKKSLTTLMAMHDPKEMHKILNKQITAIKNSRKFIGRYEAYEFGSQLNAMLDKIKRYLVKQAPELAIRLCKRFVEIDAKLFERVDDSNGDLGAFYDELWGVIDESFSYSKESPADIAKYLVDTCLSDEYGNRYDLINNLKHSLNKKVIKAIESYIPLPEVEIKYPNFRGNDYSKEYDRYHRDTNIINIHKRIADKKGDVDRYIMLCQKTGIDGPEICEIAKRLNNAFRSEESIQWLLQIKPEDRGAHDKDKLLIEAYQLEGNDTAAKQVIWNRFKRHIDAKDYLAYIKMADNDEKQKAQQEALEIAMQAEYISQGFQFLHDIGNYDAIETLFLQRGQEVKGHDYYVYRPISSALYKHGKALIASLLRRKLVESILEKAQSKYYRYAASDYKLAGDYAKNVTDWQGYYNHEKFIEALKQKHSRKRSFLELIAQAEK